MLYIFAILFSCVSAEELRSTVTWKSAEYQVVSVDLTQHELHLFGQVSSPRTMQSVFELAEKEKLKPLVAMNAGMYTPKHNPVGLFVTQGVEYKSLNLRDGHGNFHLKPNGVFLLSKDGEAKVIESSKYLEYSEQKDIELATQSGPLLLADGVYHPALQPKSKNKHIRNGVCIVDSTHLYLIISKEPVRFYDLASLMKEKLGCQDGLYLDGAISLMQGKDDTKSSQKLGPILLVNQK